jgi:heme oxygenase
MLGFAATTALALQLPCGAPPRTRPLRMQLTDQEQKISEAMEIKPVSAESARSTGLALALDDGTRKSHSVAENTAFVTGFFRGIATKQAFGQLVASLYFVYDAMESAFTECDDEGVRALDYPQLRRRAALEEDMAYYFGPEWRDSVQPSPATRKYVARVEEVAREAPYLLIAHMYTRYLGDLFGGQMMGGMARRSLDLDASLGTKFYEFDDIPQTKPFIEEWYAQLNKLELSDEQKERIVDEGNEVFRLNIEVFEELEGNPAKALFTLAISSLRSALGLVGGAVSGDV